MAIKPTNSSTGAFFLLPDIRDDLKRIYATTPHVQEYGGDTETATLVTCRYLCEQLVAGAEDAAHKGDSNYREKAIYKPGDPVNVAAFVDYLFPGKTINAQAVEKTALDLGLLTTTQKKGTMLSPTATAEDVRNYMAQSMLNVFIPAIRMFEAVGGEIGTKCCEALRQALQPLLWFDLPEEDRPKDLDAASRRIFRGEVVS